MTAAIVSKAPWRYPCTPCKPASAGFFIAHSLNPKHPMDPGKLDSRILLRRRTTSRDAAGQPLDTWVTVAPVWANIQYQTGKGAIKADRTTGQASVSIRIRWRADVCTGMHAAYGATVYDIKAVLPQDRVWLDLVCEVLQ